MKRVHNPYLTPRARELRIHSTKQENHLWYDYLREYPVRFRRQVSLDRFIVDFFCSKAWLIIEIDGSQHFTDEGKIYDSERTAILEEYGYRIIRFSDSEVDNSFETVCEIIDNEVKKGLEKRRKKKSG